MRQNFDSARVLRRFGVLVAFSIGLASSTAWGQSAPDPVPYSSGAIAGAAESQADTNGRQRASAATTLGQVIPTMFGGSVVATGETLHLPCVYVETWDLYIVVTLSDGAGTASLSGTLTTVPLVDGCASRTVPLLFSIPLVSDSTIHGSRLGPGYLTSIEGTQIGTTIEGTFNTLVVLEGASGGQQGSFVLNGCVAEVCDDGVDNDCDGQVDEVATWYQDSDGDGYGNASISVQACDQPSGHVPDNTDCDDTRSDVNPGQTEECEGVDNDCDGLIDEAFDADGDTYTTCGDFTGVRTNGLPGGKDCDDTKSAVNPAAIEACNDVDDDCDGSVDDGNPDGGLACGTLQPGVCANGVTVCSGGSLSCVPNVGPSAELCDGLDNDCDGSVDDGNPGGGLACTTGQPGVCAAGTTVCSNNSISCVQNAQPSAEICDALDNDCDGAIDEGGVCPLLTSLSPARVWVGLRNAADVGIRFDLAAKVYLNDVEVGSGQLDSVAGGSSGFDNARLDTIKLSLIAPVSVTPGSSFRIEVLVRNACRNSGRNSGRAVLWYNGQPIDHGPRADAGSHFDAKIGVKRDYFLRESAALSITAGSSRLSVDQDAGSPCSDFKSFGTWSTTLP